VVTTLSFTVPLFVLPLAAVFLKEHIGWQRWFATLLGFVGILVIVHPANASLDNQVLSLIISAIMFASLDVINKKIVINETMLSMLFYSALGTTLLSLPFVIPVWVTPHWDEILVLALLGGGANLLLFCLLKAFSATDVSALAPYKYIELLFSGVIGFILFHESPSPSLIMGALIIIPTTLYLAYYENQKRRRQSPN
jgi:S-adenosylmethionine uptake transporter